MASRRTNQLEPVGTPSVSPIQGITLLTRQIQKGKELLASRPLTQDAHTQWRTATRDFLIKAFGEGHRNVKAVMDAGTRFSYPMNAGEAWWENNRAEVLTSQLGQLATMVELLNTEFELSGSANESHREVRIVKQIAPNNRDIFVVHGHNEKVKEAAARFLEKLHLTPVILHEKPNQGRTVIEKFTDYSDVSFAVVLLTADDRGGKIDEAFDKQRKRARQNVILELGFFLGKLGRRKVCALYEDGVEIPSDYDGVLFVKLDDRGAWKIDLAKEIKATGIEVDMNLVFNA